MRASHVNSHLLIWTLHASLWIWILSSVQLDISLVGCVHLWPIQLKSQRKNLYACAGMPYPLINLTHFRIYLFEYYMLACGYEFYVLVFNWISHSLVAFTRDISSWSLKDKTHIHVRACHILCLLCSLNPSVIVHLFIWISYAHLWHSFTQSVICIYWAICFVVKIRLFSRCVRWFWPRLVSKLGVRLTGIHLQLWLDLFSASFQGGQQVVLSDRSVHARVPTRDGPRKSPVPGGFAFLYLCSLCRFVAL